MIMKGMVERRRQIFQQDAFRWIQTLQQYSRSESSASSLIRFFEEVRESIPCVWPRLQFYNHVPMYSKSRR